MAMRPGKLKDSLAFDAPSYDANQVQKGWTADALTCWGNIRYLRGGETVQAARLDGRQPVVITIRSNAVARSVTTDWIVRDTRRGVTYNIKGAVPTDDDAWVEITAESGVAV